VNHVKSGFFFASKRNKIFASISNFASEAKVRAHPSSVLSQSMYSNFPSLLKRQVKRRIAGKSIWSVFVCSQDVAF
jgi:hypothetical protein